jgi:hypothetical protein
MLLSGRFKRCGGSSMSFLQSFPVEDVVRRGSIRDADVAFLRSSFELGAPLTCAEAEQLVALHQVCPVKDAAWAELFVDILTDHFVNQAAPEGYMTAAKATWLIGLISRDGLVASKIELDLLLAVLEAARWAPVSLVRFALDQVRHAVATGEGPIRAVSPIPAGSIGEGEIELIRRVLYAFGNGCLAVTRAEAELLFEIDAALTGPAPRVWMDLFVKAMANLVLSASGRAVPTRERALAQQPWRGPDAHGATATAEAEDALYPLQSSEERAIARLERQRIEIITGEEIAEGDAAWLVERLGREGARGPSTDALLVHLSTQAPAADLLCSPTECSDRAA